MRMITRRRHFWRHTAFLLLFTFVTVYTETSVAQTRPAGKHTLKTLVAKHAHANGVPTRLAHAVVMIESGYRPRAISKGNYGLMQIRLGTARAMGFRGHWRRLLSPEVNLRYGMRYLGRAWRSSHHNVCGTVKRYQTGTASGRISRATLRYCVKAKRLMARR